ncbi:rhodanese-like domain-containing protein 4A, chloroplastic isoform X1 [Silene latifolia]|uniref:rhodanese-like domain-containing protein 4A, chloroplastic isoform X1 n=1 Tax=Silene latifolia TaxID=37657 RepID=UPI003D7744F6
MASLSLCLSSSSPLLKPNKALENPLQIPLSTSSNQISSNVTALKSHLSFPILMGFLSCSSSLPSLAAEIEDPSSQKINLETTLVTIDEFFNKYPYFVAGVTFIWLIGLPLLQEYLNKYKFISALDAFKKLRDDSSAQLLDIRDDKSVGFLASPNLKIFNKRVLQLPFNESDQAGFLNKVESNFVDPQNTVVCILDNFDGNSMKVAELLFKNGFKEAYAIKGGVRGKKGWQEIQEEFLPPAVHVFRRKKAQKSPQHKENGAASQPNTEQVSAAGSDIL